MSIPSYSAHLLDTVEEEDKLKDTYLVANIEHAIAYLAYDKQTERMQYNFYNGLRDKTELQHLVDNYGVGSPTDVPFIPIMRKRIKAIANKTLQSAMDFQVTAANQRAVETKLEKRKAEMMQELALEAKRNMEQKKFPVVPEPFIEKLRKKYGSHWQADFEIAAQDYITYLLEKHRLKAQFHKHMEDFCISGQMYRRDFIKYLGKDPQTWVCMPEDFWFESNPNSLWVKDCRRVVYRRFMSPTMILSELGPYLKDEDVDKIARTLAGYFNERWRKEVMFIEGRYGEQVSITDAPRYESDLLEVFHVEWKAVNKVELKDKKEFELAERSGTPLIQGKYILREDRYEGYKINAAGGIYALVGKSKYVPRVDEDPYRCTLSYNGLTYNMRNGVPFSMVAMTREIQNMYDLTHFHLNNLMAAARPGGTYTVLEHMPKVFGATPEERLMKTAGYEKTLSQKLISISQEGTEGEFQFNNYGNYPSNLDGGLIQSFVEYTKLLEQMADSITGLNPRMLGEMEERDGKGTTMMALQNGEVITKDLYYMHSMLFRDTLTNLLNLARLSFKEKTYTNAYSLGKGFKAFTLLPKEFSMMDFNIFISDETTDKIAMQKIDELMMVAVQAGRADLNLPVELVTSRSLTEKKEALLNAIKESEEGLAKQLEQLNAQAQEQAKQLEELQKRNQQLEKEGGEIVKQKLMLDKTKAEAEIKLKQRELDIKDKEVTLRDMRDKQLLEAEVQQLYDDNPNNNEIKNK